jgi:hypothetical protein
MSDINDGHVGGAIVVAGATFPIAMYVFSSLILYCYLFHV